MAYRRHADTGFVTGYGEGAPPFRMVPRFLVLGVNRPEGVPVGEAGPGRPLEGTPDRIVLEYEESSGLFAPVWLSVAPEEARGCWRLQVTPQFEAVVGLLVHRGVPLMWMTSDWKWVGRNHLDPVSPRYLIEMLKPIEVQPT